MFDLRECCERPDLNTIGAFKDAVQSCETLEVNHSFGVLTAILEPV